MTEPAASPETASAAVTLRPMTDDEYAVYRARNVPAYADELVRSRGMSREKATADSEDTFPVTLAEATGDGYLFRLLADGSREAGWMWLGVSERSPSSLFVFDVEIEEEQQGRGLGRAAMLAAEDLARDKGFSSMSLNVFGWNTRAQNLYRSLGYEVQAMQMVKLLGEPR